MVSSPFVTPYFTSWLESSRKVRGCSLGYRTLKSYFSEVHAILLHTVGDIAASAQGMGIQPPSSVVDLLLQVNTQNDFDKLDEVMARLVLILDTNRPIHWRLKVQLSDTLREQSDKQHTMGIPYVVMSQGSTIESTIPLRETHKSWHGKKHVQRYIKKNFRGHLASYSEVKGANRLVLRVGVRQPGIKGINKCDMYTQEESRLLVAMLAIQLTTEGCFYKDTIDDTYVDVYVIELDGGSKRNRLHRTLQPVLIHLQAEDIVLEPRNVTLILKSSQPIKWQLGISGSLGNLLIVSSDEDIVVNEGHVNMKVLSKNLPNSLNTLLLDIATEFGPPIMYAKTGPASTLRLVIAGKDKTDISFCVAMLARLQGNQPLCQVYWNLNVSQYQYQCTSKAVSAFLILWLAVSGIESGTIIDDMDELIQQFPSPDNDTFLNQPESTELESSIMTQLKSSMVVECGHNRIIVSFPLPLFQEVGSPHLAFNDAFCSSQRNVTHVYLSSHITSCGSTSNSDGRFIIFTNAVHVVFGSADIADKDLESSGSLPDSSGLNSIFTVVCKHLPFFPNMRVDDNVLDSVDMLNTETSSQSASLYHLDIFRDKQLKEIVDFSASSSASREAQYDEILYVKGWIDGVVPVEVVTENCWVSNSSNPSSRLRVVLLKNACPMDLSVEIQPTDSPTLGRFSFQVNKVYRSLGQFYVHCRLGVCTKESEHAKGNLIVCVDPVEYCSHQSLRPYLDKAVSTAQQLVTVGPLTPVAKRVKPLTSYGVLMTSEMLNEGQTRVIHVGISTEVTVCIALTSFTIGVCLTAALWCIHAKTDPFRRQLSKQPPIMRGETSAMT
uniref:ZP domain-containing protein n=1 Tax=Timema poppense TaxID=170557 RepID=A0A7R9D1R5_TIMPO|nr:unnamed protein product [Timema poppensis]